MSYFQACSIQLSTRNSNTYVHCYKTLIRNLENTQSARVQRLHKIAHQQVKVDQKHHNFL